MKTLQPIEPLNFVKRVQPLLEQKDFTGLRTLLKANWTKEQIIGLLTCRDEDARKVAAVALSLVGCPKCVPELSKQLQDSDPVVNQLAEHALWMIWFRSGKSDEANEQIGRGSQAVGDKDYVRAIAHFDQALAADPEFAEAYNQRAIAHYLQENFRASIGDCRKAVHYMPCHFGAWAGMGHCYAHLGELAHAKTSYEKALEINPHLECVRESISEIKRKLGE